MGYRGFFQYIGECGHYWEVDASVLLHGTPQAAKKAIRCPVCKKPFSVRAEVNTTNGWGLEYGSDAVNAKFKMVGFTDEWKVDHYGNRYAIKHFTYKPIGKRWKT